MKVCPKCSERVGNNADVCPFCGHQFPIVHSHSAPNSYSFRTCPNCHESVNAKHARCPECGQIFRDAGKPVTIPAYTRGGYKESEAWSGRKMVLWVILTMLVPLIGILLGAANLSNQDRKVQAQMLLAIGLVESFITALILVSA